MNILTPTADGSNTLYNETIGEHYHSAHGALQEAKHVFIQAGLIDFVTKKNVREISIFEVGFGTGLNFLLTLDYCQKHDIKLNYTAIEAFPLTVQVLEDTGYRQFVAETTYQNFIGNYNDCLKQAVKLSSLCELQIVVGKLESFGGDKLYDVVYYDAFSVRHQPEMWTNEIIAKTCSLIKGNGFFVTYAITGNLKRAVKACGFEIQKLPGAPGKREMLRAIKTT